MLYVFAYVLAMCVASPAPIMKAAFGRLHNGGRAAFVCPPTVVEYIMGDGRLKGLLGSIKGEIIIDGKRTGVITNVGTGFSDLQRENYLKEDSPEYIPIGSIVSFSFMEMTKDGVPRHPVYRGIRDDINI